MKTDLKIVLGVLVFIGAGGLAYFMFTNPNGAPSAAVQPAKTATTAAGTTNQEQYPVPKKLKDTDADDLPNTPLPKLDESDDAMQAALAKILDNIPLEQLLNSRDFVRSVVVTIDNLTKPVVPARFLPVKPPEGDFIFDKKRHSISEKNYARYAPYVNFADKVNLTKLEHLYVKFYPLFQQVYVESNGGGYFNDRLVIVIDSLLKAPNQESPIGVQKAIVSYRYTDEELEKLNAGQKILLRMGPENAFKMKVVLKKMRHRLTHLKNEL